MRRFTLLAPVLLAAVAVLAAGCGSSNPAAGPLARTTTANPAPVPSDNAKTAVADATAKTQTSSADVEVQVLLRKPGASNAISYDATGKVVPDGGKLRIDRSQIGGAVEQEIFLRDNGNLVLYSSPSQIKLPKGKTWLMVDMTKYGKQRYGADTTFLAGADQDPLQAAKLLASPVAKVTDLGQDWLPDRTLNTHYKGVVDVVAAARAAGVKGSGLTTLKQDLGKVTQTIDVWVDKDGRLARVQVSAPQKAPDGTQLELRETTDFTNYGTKASVQPPPAKLTEDYFNLVAK